MCEDKKSCITINCGCCRNGIDAWKSLEPTTGKAEIALPVCNELNIVITGTNNLRTVNYPIHVIPTEATTNYYFGFHNGQTNSGVLHVSKEKVELERFILNDVDITESASTVVHYR